ncbi:flavin reductase family protein [Rhodococcus triatomae]|nr:flavin reductase like domain-containing protein [Rhodococcus triatomae BKS 15-14]
MPATATRQAFDATDPTAFRRVLGNFPSGVAAITSTGPDSGPVGMAVSSFTSVSLDPPLVAFFPAKTSSTWPVVRERGAFCVNVLGSDQEEVCRRLAAKSDNKFDDIAWTPDSDGLPVLTNAVAWIHCDIESVHDAGDHEIVIGRVRHLAVDETVRPLLFYRGGYGRVESPTTPPHGSAHTPHAPAGQSDRS